MKKRKVIVLGIGNSGRQDDGLGWLFIDYLNEESVKYDLDYRYQLQIEDAELISKYDTVIFVDAVKEKTRKGFYFKNCEPSSKFSFSTHELLPETILYLAEDLYQHKPKAFILGIEGVEWNLKIGLSPKAKENFEKAKEYFNHHQIWKEEV
ncbi:MAG: hydrogenase maturation protease, partial [Bacteroidota bacterium]